MRQLGPERRRHKISVYDRGCRRFTAWNFFGLICKNKPLCPMTLIRFEDVRVDFLPRAQKSV